ncbi:unnamed protein product [Phytophthora lilii]|uniref:Unnamed protein product n=1 Tax=Phytophthora lilii TaxID=2077276 RepID=A0A9W6U8M0_9STRA|nr:unnamed protein product [Phytophthora lilii]
MAFSFRCDWRCHRPLLTTIDAGAPTSPLRMKSPEPATGLAGGPYPEEILLEAYDLERLQKTWQHFLLLQEIEQEEQRYQDELRRVKLQEQEQRKKAEAEAEALRRQREKEAALRREKERAEAEQKKKLKEVAVSDMRAEEEEPQVKITKTKSVKAKPAKTEMQPKQKTKPKRITPVSLPPQQPEEEEPTSEENQELDGYDSPPPELPDDGLLNVLSLDKSSDSDIDDEPSMVSLILPVAHDSPKRVQPSPSKKKTPTPHKRFAKKIGGPPLDFNFTNAEAKRQAKAAEAAAEAEGDSDEAETEPEPVPPPSTLTPKKRLKRRKEVAKERATAPTGGRSLMAAVANATLAIKPKKGVVASNVKATANNASRKKTVNVTSANNNKGVPNKKKSHASEELSTGDEEVVRAPLPKKKVIGKETMSIKQRLANAELLARMNKMQDLNTPKVLGKKSKKTQNKAATKTLAAQRAEFRKALASDAAEPDVPQRDQAIEEGDLNISLNSSGLISDNDSPENLRPPTRKRARGAVDGDVTPTKKLQFLEITKRLVKSPMPRYLRTPTPLMSPVVASALVKARAASPGPRGATAPNTAATRRLNSAPVRPKKTTNANRFGISAGGASVSAGGGFSMFDAFVNSGSSGVIPRLKNKTRGDVSPSV